MPSIEEPAAAVSCAMASWPEAARISALKLRLLIVEVAVKNPSIGALTETLKWGEPAFLTAETGAGTTLRLAWKPARPDHIALLVHCQTSLVDTWRTLYPGFDYEGNRALLVGIDGEVETQALAHCIEMALTYHETTRRARSVRA